MKTKGKIQDIYPLTPMQEGMLFHSLYEKGSSTYFVQTSYRLHGELNVSYIKKSLNHLLRRYDILRTVFIYEGRERPLQVVLKEREIDFYFEDIRKIVGKDIKKIDEFVEQSRKKDRQRSFDLSKDVLMRVSILQVGDSDYEFIWSHHHILMDGWCTGILVLEFLEIYNSYLEDRPYRLPKAKQFKTYIEWLEKQDKDEAKNYWKKYLEKYEEPATISFKLFNTSDVGYELEETFLILDDEKTYALKELAARNQATLNTLIQVSWGIMLGKYNNKNDVVYGVVVSGRPSQLEGAESMIGIFINTIPFRIRYEEKTKFNELLQRVQEEAIKIEPYHHYPLVDIQTESALKRNLFDHIIAFENYPIAEQLEGNNIENRQRRKLELSNVESLVQTNYDFNLSVVPGNQLSVNFTYNGNIYDSHTLERTVKHFGMIIDQILSNEQIAVNELILLSEEEKRKILADFNDTCTEYPKDKTIHRLFEEQAEKSSDGVAVVYMDHGVRSRDSGVGTRFMASITYKELNEKSDQLGWKLGEIGVEPDTIVGIIVERSIEMIIGILGILKVGGAYLAIDSTYPGERKRYMVNDANASILLISRALSKNTTFDNKIIYLEDRLEPITSSKQKASVIRHQASDLAYVIYTSGSTGKPKGVMVEHTSIVRLVKNTNYMHFHKEERLLQTGALEFDASTFEIWGSLLNGGRLVLVDKEKILDHETLKEAIKKHKINIMWMTSPLFNQMLDIDIEIFKGLENLLVGGDVLSPPHINRIRKVIHSLKVINGYGPTENTTFSTTYLIDDQYTGRRERIPIGKPIANSTAYIIDKYNHLVPIGVEGELVVGGDGVARGYLNDPELTAEKFKRSVISDSSLVISSSLKTNDKPSKAPNDQCPMTNGCLYRTGDLARWLPDGNIEFLGRIDCQVKVRGFRIELGEIENQLLNHDAIKDTIVIDRENDNGDKYLCVYIVLDEGHTLDVSGLREFLLRELPDYMIPSYFVPLDKIPLTPNGKVDRKALPAPGVVVSEGCLSPPGEVEKNLVEIWAEVLGIGKETISLNSNFFELGGHSLKVTIMAAKIQKELDVKIPLKKIFEAPTIMTLADYIKGAAPDKYTPVEAVEEKEYYTLSPPQKRLYSVQQINLEGTAYNICQMFLLPGELDIEAFEKSFTKLIKRHEGLRTSFEMIDGEPIQRIHEEVEFKIEWYDLGNRQKAIDSSRQESVGNREKLMPETITKNFIRHFDLSQAPLLRVGVIEGNPGDKHILMVDVHHIISDRVSHTILGKDFIDLYKGKELSPLPLQYKDFSQWQNREEQKELLKKEAKYWLKTLSGELPVLNLPTDYDRPEIQNFAGNTVSFELNEKETNILKNIVKEEEVTLYMVIFAAFTVLISKLSGQDDIIIGTPTAGRTHADFEGIIGIFVNILAIRNFPTGDKTFRKFLHEVKTRALEAFSNQEYQFENLVDKLLKKRDPSRNPIFDVVFNFLNQSNIENRAVSFIDNIDESKEAIYNFRRDTAQFDINLLAIDFEERIQFNLEYCTKLFKSSTIERFIEYFKTILSSLSLTIDQELSDIEIISPQEQEEFLTITPVARN